MVCLGAVGFALTVVVVLEFDSACWAVCDAHGLCSGEYLFSELFVFSGACSAHRSFSSLFFFLLLFVLGGGASQRQRDERLHRLTLYFLFFSSFFFPCFSSSLLLFFSLFWIGVCCVVRAQLGEHARNTTRALLFLGLFASVVCVVCTPSYAMLVAYHHDGIVVHTTHCSLLTITMFTIEH